jgi:cell division protein FtsZ
MQFDAKKGQSAVAEVEEFGEPQIAVVGIGGAGSNTINRLHNMGITGAKTIAVNTDRMHMTLIDSDQKVLIGRSITRGLGAGGYPEVGERCAELSRTELEESLEGMDLVFVTAGMGGGTGTGASPVVANIAKKQGAIVVAMVSSPFSVERARLYKADTGLAKLGKAADTVIVLDNNKLLSYVPNLPIDQAFSVMDQLISETVKGISETITTPSLINLDYADIKTIMSCGGVAVMMYGESSAQDKAEKAVHDCMNHPLLDVSYSGATGALVHITGGNDLSLREAEEIASRLTYELDSKADVIWGARINPDFEGKVRVMCIMTGIHSPNILGRGEIGPTLVERYGQEAKPPADIPWVK